MGRTATGAATDGSTRIAHLSTRRIKGQQHAGAVGIDDTVALIGAGVSIMGDTTTGSGQGIHQVGGIVRLGGRAGAIDFNEDIVVGFHLVQTTWHGIYS